MVDSFFFFLKLHRGCICSKIWKNLDSFNLTTCSRVLEFQLLLVAPVVLPTLAQKLQQLTRLVQKFHFVDEKRADLKIVVSDDVVVYVVVVVNDALILDDLKQERLRFPYFHLHSLKNICRAAINTTV